MRFLPELIEEVPSSFVSPTGRRSLSFATLGGVAAIEASVREEPVVYAYEDEDQSLPGENETRGSGQASDVRRRHNSERRATGRRHEARRAVPLGRTEDAARQVREARDGLAYSSGFVLVLARHPRPSSRLA